MPAATDGNQQVVGPCEGDGVSDVRDTCTANDEGRSAVNHTIPDPPHCLIALIARTQQRATQALSEFLDGCLVDNAVDPGRHGRHSLLLLRCDTCVVATKSDVAVLLAAPQA